MGMSSLLGKSFRVADLSKPGFVGLAANDGSGVVWYLPCSIVQRTGGHGQPIPEPMAVVQPRSAGYPGQSSGSDFGIGSPTSAAKATGAPRVIPVHASLAGIRP